MPRMHDIRPSDRDILTRLTPGISPEKLLSGVEVCPSNPHPGALVKSQIHGTLSASFPHILTGWFSGKDQYFPGILPGDWARIWWDPDPEGLYRTCFTAARVHYLASKESWRWQVFTSPGTRVGLVPGPAPDLMASGPAVSPPMGVLRRVDAMLAYYTLMPQDFRRTVHVPETKVPFVDDLFHRGRRLLPWHISGPRSRMTFVERYIRLWVHTPLTLRQVPSSRRTGTLVERAWPQAHPGAVVGLRPGSRGRWEWRVRVGPQRGAVAAHRELFGAEDTAGDAFDRAEHFLRTLGCTTDGSSSAL